MDDEPKPRFLRAAEARARRRQTDSATLLRGYRQRLHDSTYPRPECLEPYEIERLVRGGALAPDRIEHPRECPTCAALLEAAWPQKQGLESLLIIIRQAQPVVRVPQPQERLSPWQHLRLLFARPDAASSVPWLLASKPLQVAFALLILAIIMLRLPLAVTVAPASGPTVAILGFENLSDPTQQWLSAVLSEALAPALESSSEVRAVPGKRVEQAKLGLGLADVASLDRVELGRVQQNLGSDVVITGAYQAEGPDRMRLRVQVRNATGDVILEEKESWQLGSPRALASLSAKILQRLGSDAPSLSKIEPVIQASLPSSRQALRSYGEGLIALRRFDTRRAQTLLTATVSSDPDSPPQAYSALGEAWASLGFNNNALVAAQRAMERARSLPDEEEKTTEAEYYRAGHNWARALEVSRKLWERSPNDPELGLLLAEIQLGADQPLEARETLDTLRRAKRSPGDALQFDLLEARALAAESRYREQLAVASSVARKAEQLGARLSLAQARLLEGRALHRLGDWRAARTSYDEALRLNAEIGNHAGVVETQRMIGILYWRTEKLDKAEELLLQSLTTARQIGDRGQEAAAENALGNVFADKGRVAEAEKKYKRALEIAGGIGNLSHAAVARTNLAVLLRSQGMNTEAESRLGEVLRICQAIHSRSCEALAFYAMGSIRFDEGDLLAAQQRFQQALDIHREVGDLEGIAKTSTALADVMAIRADLVGAKLRFEEALATQKEIGDVTGVWWTRISLVELAIDEGRSNEALEGARQAVKVAQGPEAEAIAWRVLALAHFERGDLVHADEAIAQARLARKTSEVTRQQTAIVDARIGVASQRLTPEQAVHQLEPIAKGDSMVALEARLARGEIELRHGQPTQGRSHLTELVKDAKKLGAERFVRKAEALTAG